MDSDKVLNWNNHSRFISMSQLYLQNVFIFPILAMFWDWIHEQIQEVFHVYLNKFDIQEYAVIQKEVLNFLV